MGRLDPTENRIQGLYERARNESAGGFVDPHKYSYLDFELRRYAKENNCSYSEALIIAKTGKKNG